MGFLRSSGIRRGRAGRRRIRWACCAIPRIRRWRRLLFGLGLGRLELLDEVVGSREGSGPIDMTITGNGRFLYVLNASDGSVGMFRINPDGSLGSLGVVDELLDVPFAQGIVGH